MDDEVKKMFEAKEMVCAEVKDEKTSWHVNNLRSSVFSEGKM